MDSKLTAALKEIERLKKENDILFELLQVEKEYRDGESCDFFEAMDDLKQKTLLKIDEENR